MNCRLCGRKVENGCLCRYHLIARDELKKGYERWKEAYGDLSWKEFLNRVRRIDGTGQWVKEVAGLMESGDID